jgi:hypothetical protein
VISLFLSVTPMKDTSGRSKLPMTGLHTGDPHRHELPLRTTS